MQNKIQTKNNLFWKQKFNFVNYDENQSVTDFFKWINNLKKYQYYISGISILPKNVKLVDLFLKKHKIKWQISSIIYGDNDIERMHLKVQNLINLQVNCIEINVNLKTWNNFNNKSMIVALWKEINIITQYFDIYVKIIIDLNQIANLKIYKNIFKVLFYLNPTNIQIKNFNIKKEIHKEILKEFMLKLKNKQIQNKKVFKKLIFFELAANFKLINEIKIYTQFLRRYLSDKYINSKYIKFRINKQEFENFFIFK